MALQDQTFLLGLVFFPEGSGWNKLDWFNRGLNHSTVGHPTWPENGRELNAGNDETDGENFRVFKHWSEVLSRSFGIWASRDGAQAAHLVMTFMDFKFKYGEARTLKGLPARSQPDSA